jgi:hypothetical protein
VLHGQPTGRKFVAGYGHQGKVVGVLGWNSPASYANYASS